MPHEKREHSANPKFKANKTRNRTKMELWPFSWSSEYSMSSSWPRKHILTRTDLSSQALHTRHGPLGGLRSAHVAIWNTHLSSYPSVMGNVLVFCWVEIWILPVLSVLSVPSVPYGPVGPVWSCHVSNPEIETCLGSRFRLGHILQGPKDKI